MIVQTVLLLFFSTFFFSMPSKVMIIVIEFMFLSINKFWALLRLILALAANINSIVLFYQRISRYSKAIKKFEIKIQFTLLELKQRPRRRLLKIEFILKRNSRLPGSVRYANDSKNAFRLNIQRSTRRRGLLEYTKNYHARAQRFRLCFVQ